MGRLVGSPDGAPAGRLDQRSLIPVGWPAQPAESQRVVPSWSDPLVAQASRIVGGPLGRHAVIGRHWFWTPLRVVLLIGTITLTLGWLGKAPCGQTYRDSSGALQVDWHDYRQYKAMCYSDTIPLYSVERLDRPGLSGFPYATSWVERPGQVRYMEYPVLTGLYQWGVAKLAQGWVSVARSGWLPTAAPAIVHFNISAVGLAAAWLVTVWALVLLSPGRPWDAALAGLSPLVVVHAFTNFDALAVALATTGLLAWSRGAPVLAGVLLGLGGATKLYPLFLLLPILLVCLRARRLRPGGIAVSAAALSWTAVNLPIAVLFPTGWAEFFRLNNQRPADPDTLYTVLSTFTGWPGLDGPLRPGQVPVMLNMVSAGLFVLACLAISWVALKAPQPPRLVQLCFLVVAAFLLVNKVWSPQYSLWLVPLAALAIRQWKPVLAWMTVDALLWAPRMAYYLGTDHRGLPIEPFLTAVVLRDAAVLFLICLVLHHLYREADPDMETYRGFRTRAEPVMSPYRGQLS